MITKISVLKLSVTNVNLVIVSVLKSWNLNFQARKIIINGTRSLRNYAFVLVTTFFGKESFGKA